MNFDDKVRQMAGVDVIPLPRGYEERLHEVCAALEKTRRMQRRSGVARLLLAAALIGCCVGLLAMGTDRVLPLLSGGTLTIRGNGDRSSGNAGGGFHDLVVLEDDRLWLTAGGQRLDVTDLVDEETPYLYTSTDPLSGLTHYAAVGGTPEAFGWAEWVREEGQDMVPTVSSGAFHVLWRYEGELYDPTDLTEELQRAWDAEGDTHTGQMVYHPWYLSALDQLGLEQPEAHINPVWRGEPVP